MAISMVQTDNFSGLNHIGVLKTLFEADLLPRIISGASSGSIVASLACTRTDDELESLFHPENVYLVYPIANYLRLSAEVLDRKCLTSRIRRTLSSPSSSDF
jgi:predicted acylesterase/phospholipase RssA